MNISDFLTGIKKLQLAYNQKFDKDKLEIWYTSLKVMTNETYQERIDELIKIKRFMPNVAEILNKKETNYEERDYTGFDFESLYVNVTREET